jgi:hypothetical protein
LILRFTLTANQANNPPNLNKTNTPVGSNAPRYDPVKSILEENKKEAKREAEEKRKREAEEGGRRGSGKRTKG